MGATKGLIAPWFYSEWLLSGMFGQPPLLGCGVSTICHGAGIATGNESAMGRNGRLLTKAARKATLVKGFRAFLRVADSNGIPDRDDHVRISQAMFPDLPLPASISTPSWDDVMDLMKSGFAVSLALRLRVLGSRNSIDLTTADHQTLFWSPRKDGKVKAIGPMRQHSDRYAGHLAELSEVRQAAKAIVPSGNILGWRYPILGWTQAKLQTKELRAEVADAKRRAAKLESRIVNKDGTIATLRERVAELVAGTPVDCGTLVRDALRAERQAIIESIEAREAP